MRRIRRHHRLSTLAAVIVAVIVIAGITAPKKHATAPPTATTIHQPAMSGAERSARSYVKDHGADANRVQANLLSVQLDVSSKASMNQLALDAQTGHDNLDAIRNDFAVSYDSGALGDSEVQVFAAANDLKNALGSLVAYTGNPNPATLARFTTEYRTASGEWNAGVQGIWRLAHRHDAPAI